MRNKKLIIIFSILLSITALVLVSGILFSVKTVTAQCLNDPINSDSVKIEEFGNLTLNEYILKDPSFKKGSSIFLLNDKDITQKIESRVHEIKIINIKRHFPNRVVIRYVKMYNIFQVKVSDELYYLTKCDGKITHVNNFPMDKNEVIELKIDGRDLDPTLKEGDYLFGGASTLLSEVVTNLERCGLKDSLAAVAVDFVDLREAGRDTVYIGLTGGNESVVLKILSSNNRLLDKIKCGIEAYASDELGADKMLTIYENFKGKIEASAGESDYVP